MDLAYELFPNPEKSRSILGPQFPSERSRILTHTDPIGTPRMATLRNNSDRPIFAGNKNSAFIGEPTSDELINWICELLRINYDQLVSLWQKTSRLMNASQPNNRQANRRIHQLSSCATCHVSCDGIYHKLIQGVDEIINNEVVSLNAGDLKCCICKYGASKILNNQDVACGECLQRTPGISKFLPSFM